ncbi:hypothetical protein [Latilactobacillus graminis]|uniref:Uncharacterized protein n=2 Tax=Latilactobacillus graminis TaxID=60519 RepID=A0AA89L530_9LACO|nr:hypothetical protein [Latilactobacillus graminis]KRM23870.1 hypothetical protein FC90_GL001390 [Latilactobacillus graminis DSM 20719]QFP79759.1 hypothetical protein LG542_05660 [Latilactobacillus graminis]
MREQIKQTQSMMLDLFEVATHASQQSTITTSLIEAQQALLTAQQLYSDSEGTQQTPNQSTFKHFVECATHLNLMIVKSLDNHDLAEADHIQNELSELKQLI